MKREDDFQERRKHLSSLSHEELKDRFWKLTEEIVDPLVNLAYDYTSPSIERSVLLRMGFNSIDSDLIVKEGIKWNLLGKGMGNVVLTLGKILNIPYYEAGKKLSVGIGWKEVTLALRGEENGGE